MYYRPRGRITDDAARRAYKSFPISRKSAAIIILFVVCAGFNKEVLHNRDTLPSLIVFNRFARPTREDVYDVCTYSAHVAKVANDAFDVENLGPRDTYTRAHELALPYVRTRPHSSRAGGDLKRV